jgi:O-glycosyl hydrolase
MIGGSLKTSASSVFAAYLVRYLQAYAGSGVPVDYISIQNEPLYLPNDYPGMSMSSTEQLSLLRITSCRHCMPRILRPRYWFSTTIGMNWFTRDRCCTMRR